MWANTAADGRPAPEADDAKATQVNFVLHLGLHSTPEDALAQFATVTRFSQRYPSRIVVLCPRHTDVEGCEMRVKTYGECYLGKSKSDKRCVEFVMLGYSRAARPFLENQVSICLSTDLPLYYWAHRFSASGRLADYRYLLSRAKRVMIDSAIAPADAFTYPWPNPAALRDLVYCRLLPVRQTIGQFLSSYEPAALADGLSRVAVSHDANLAAESCVILAWLRRRLAACGVVVDSVPFATAPLAPGVAGNLGVQFEYAGRTKHFQWSGDIAAGTASFAADLGGGRTVLPASVGLLSAEAALSEAMFF
jgi:hypothetical protein